jgi:hypothetical protein
MGKKTQLLHLLERAFSKVQYIYIYIYKRGNFNTLVEGILREIASRRE